MAALHTEHETFTYTEAAFREAGCDFNVRFQAQFFIPLFTFVEAGQGYSIIDPLSAESPIRLYCKDDAPDCLQTVQSRPSRWSCIHHDAVSPFALDDWQALLPARLQG